jgi:hypothetical protein
LVKADGLTCRSNRFEEARCPKAVGIARVLGLVERNLYMALSGEVVDLIRPYRLDETIKAARVGHITVMEDKSGALDMARVSVLKMVDSAAIQ